MTRKRGSSNPLVEQVARLQEEVAALKAAKVTYVEGPVTSVSPGTQTFAVDVGADQPLAGVPTNEQFLPAVGDTVRLALAGAQPVYQHDQLAENAITNRELAPGSVAEETLSFVIADMGGTEIVYGTTDPGTTYPVGTLWVKKLAQINGVDQHETRRWDGTAWSLLADQKATQALLDAATAQAAAQAADQKGVNALANAATAQQTATNAGTAASTAQTTANSKTTHFSQASPPATTGRTTGDTWDDTDDGNRRYYWNGSSWTTSPLGAAGISATARQLGALTIFRQSSPPTVGVLDNDFWIDSDDGKPYVRVAGAWVLSEDAEINTAITAAATAQATADSKVRIFAQPSPPTGLTADDVGDQWLDTDEGNKQHFWQSSGTVERTNWAYNPSFEAQTAGTVTAHTGWDSGGVGAGTVTRSVATTAPVHGTRVGRLVGTSMAIAATNSLYFRQVIPAAPGDVVRVAATAAVTVASTNFPVELLVEWRNAAGTIIGSGTALGNGSVGNQSLVYTSTALPALTASIMVTFRRRGTGAGTALTNADLNLDAVLVERNRQSTAPTTYFDGSTGGEARWDGTEYLSTSTTWQEGAAGSFGWVPRLLRTGAFQPNSIVARDVVATGTVTATLLEAILVLATVVIAGDPNGAHTRLDSVGLRAFVADPNDGIPNEVAVFGKTSGGRDSTGRLTWTVDDTGFATYKGLAVTTDPRFMGDLLSTHLGRKAQIVAWTFKWANPGATTNEVGLVELSFKTTPGHSYVTRACNLFGEASGGGDQHTVPFRLRATFDGTRPTITSQMMATANSFHRFDAFPWENISTEVTSLHHGGNAIQTVRYLLTVAKPAGATNAGQWTDYTYSAPFMYIEDMGLTPGDSGQPNTGNGTLVAGGTASAPANAKVDSETIFDCTWTKSYDGLAQPLPYGESYQGRNPFYDRGNTRGFIGFPSMTASLSGKTIRYVKVWLWYGHWARLDGGFPQVGLHGNATAPATATGQFALGPFPAPWLGRGEGAWIEIPSAYWGGIQNGTYKGVVTGPGSTEDQGYAGHANGWNQPNFPKLAVGWTQ